MKYNHKDIQLSQNSKNVILPMIIFSNLLPLYGVIKYNWTIFSVVYIYWVELLIISTFQLLKIIFAKGDPSASAWSKIILALKFFGFRTGLFFFYLLFIVVFLGLMLSAGKKDNSDMFTMFDVLFFKGNFYKITLLSFVVYNTIEFLILFIWNGKYLLAKPSDNFVILDARIIVVHIVVVLGTFLYQGVTEQFHFNHKNAMIACVGLFVTVKIIADIIQQYLNEGTDESAGKFI